MEDKISRLKTLVDQADHIAFFGGAGVSTDSGIPDFRSAQGIFVQDMGTDLSPERIISYSFAKDHPQIFFDFYFDKMVFPEALPNLAHEYLASLEKSGKRISVITQNIDGLHEKAGSKEIYNLHGSVVQNYCVECEKSYKLKDLNRDHDGIPRCNIDGGIVRPDIVLYEEQLDMDVLSGAIQAISQADLMIIAGTSLLVQPASGLIDYFNGENLILINKTPTLIRTSKNTLVFQDSINQILGQIK